MRPAIETRLQALDERHEEITRLLSQPDVIADQHQFRELSREYARLEPVVQAFGEFRAARHELQDVRELLDDAELADEARADSERLTARLADLEAQLQILLLPRDPLDDADLFLEVRAGTGGDEAALFAGDLLRMYSNYAEARGWQVEAVSASPGDMGGYKAVVVRISGEGAHAHLKFEAGTHRVQRVPETESQGRIHTSAATVAVLPEQDSIDDIAIDAADLRIDTFRASGAGGQHVNKTDSAIRITHLPSGTVVECQDERSQHKNRARAMSLLRARLLDAERSRQAAAQSESRRLQVGSGDRSQRIRTYNFPQGRITDHRINLTVHRLEEVLGGDLDELIGALQREQQTEDLKALGEAG